MIKANKMLQCVAVVGLLSVGSSALAPQAYARGSVRAGISFYQANSGWINPVIGWGLGTVCPPAKIVWNIMAPIISNKTSLSSSSSRKNGQPPSAHTKQGQFSSFEEILSNPIVSNEDKDLVRSRYQPGAAKISAELQNQVKLAHAEVLAKKISVAEADARVRKVIIPMIKELVAPLEANGMKFVIK